MDEPKIKIFWDPIYNYSKQDLRSRLLQFNKWRALRVPWIIHLFTYLFYLFISVCLFVCLFTILEPVSSYPLDDKDAVCKKGLCECDSRAVQCFAKARFNPSNVDYDTSKCWLGEQIHYNVGWSRNRSKTRINFLSKCLHGCYSRTHR